MHVHIVAHVPYKMCTQSIAYLKTRMLPYMYFYKIFPAFRNLHHIRYKSDILSYNTNL